MKSTGRQPLNKKLSGAELIAGLIGVVLALTLIIGGWTWALIVAMLLIKGALVVVGIVVVWIMLKGVLIWAKRQAD